MKNFSSRKTKGVLLALLAAMTLLTTACQKNSSSAPVVVGPSPMYPGGCGAAPCGVVGGAALYGGATVNSQYLQVQFQVTGDPSGNGPGTISGMVNVIQPYYCSGMLPGSFPIVATQPGTLTAGIYQGWVALGNVQGAIQVVPGHPGLMTISFPSCSVPLEMNF